VDCLAGFAGVDSFGFFGCFDGFGGFGGSGGRGFTSFFCGGAACSFCPDSWSDMDIDPYMSEDFSVIDTAHNNRVSPVEYVGSAQSQC